jgi:TldD protein
MCEALDVSRSGFYAWLTRPRSLRSIVDEVLGIQVRQSFVGSDRTYGARRVWHDVLAVGHECGLHRVERLMWAQGLRARPRRRGLPVDRGARSAIADNVLDRQFQADAPNQKWVADFTYIWTAEGWLYAAAVLDLYSRRIVGWSMHDSMTSQLVADALMMAVWRRGKPVQLLHLDDADLYFQTPARGLEPGRRHRQERQLSASTRAWACARWPARRRPSPTRRHLRSLAAGRGAHRAHHCRAGQNRRVKVACPRQGRHQPLAVRRPGPRSARWTAPQKVALLEKVEKLARAKDPRVVQVMAGLAAEYDVVLVARADGTLAADVRPLVRLSVTVIAEQNGRREWARAAAAAVSAWATSPTSSSPKYVDEAVNAALTNLESRPAPAGEMTVVLGPGWPGVLLHEAVGHGLEGDFNRKGSSAFSGRIGQRVAAKGVTVLDDGTIADRRGSLNVDDEGHASQRNVLIEDGILKGYIQDAMNARLMGVKPTGNGRRESYAHVPMPRMTNTYMLAATRTRRRSSPASSAACTPPTSAAARSTSPAASSCSRPARPSGWRTARSSTRSRAPRITMIGNGPESLKRVTMIGNDLAPGQRRGPAARKPGQSVPVRRGPAHAAHRRNTLTVGGTWA